MSSQGVLWAAGTPGIGCADPWGGVDPRGLTRVGLDVRFASEGMGRLDLVGSHVGEIMERARCEQLDLFLRLGSADG